MKIGIIGSGIAGIMSAYYLAKDGHRVVVYDQESYTAMKCSYANGGQISVSNSEVWNTWSNVAKGLKWMLKKDAPLLVRPSLDLDKAVWLLRFLKNTIENVYERNTAATIALGLESRIEYEKIIAEEQLQFDQTPSGILHFYKDQKYFERACQAHDLFTSNGVEWDILTPGQVYQKDYSLDRVTNIVGGIWTPSDWTGDIHKFCCEMEKVLKQKYHVTFMHNWNVPNLHEYVSFHHDVVVVCAGAESVQLAKSIGDRLPIYPVKGYSVTINVSDSELKYLPTTSLLDDQAKIVTSTLGKRLRVAGTAELNGYNYDIRKDRIDPLLNWVHTNFPRITTKDYSTWACLRPMTPNMMPIVKRSNKDSRVYYHTGHGHLGWTLSAATAKLLKKQIKGDFE